MTHVILNIGVFLSVKMCAWEYFYLIRCFRPLNGIQSRRGKRGSAEREPATLPQATRDGNLGEKVDRVT